ncbi:MAG: protein kinase [Lachnospiraceae bacterium]|nr:protein kinase [Lachnospiraceae bacterium]
MLEVGTLLDGKYKILNEIGHGGMSVVYLALNERANKTWAVKEVRKDGGNDDEVVSQGLVAETEMLKKLSHPNLPAIIDVIDREDSFIIVMDYIEGRSLQDVLNHSGPQDPDTVVEWAKQLCDVLGYLHSRKPPIIYRDMKPANVMLRPSGQVALIDFGTAREYKMTSQGDTTWLGTRGYAAPEQFGGQGQTDARTDIYNLGATIYHLLTGYSPADTQFVIYPLGQLRPELAGSGIEKVVTKCCQPKPGDRYQSCAELMYALDHVHDEDDVTRKSRKRKWAAFLAACCLMAAGLAGMGIFRKLENDTRNRSYDALLAEGRSHADDITYMAERYQQAMDLKPADPKAYNEMLDNLIRNNVKSEGNDFTTDERTSFRQAIDHSAPTRSGTSNLSILRNEDKREHDQLLFTLGQYYFSYCTNAQQDAYNTMTEISDSETLDDTQRKIRDTIINLSDYSVKLNQSATSFADYKYSYSGLWEKLYDLAHDPAAVDSNTGGDAFSLAIYRMVTSQLTTKIRNYVEGGVGQDEMNEVLDAAETYANGKMKDDSQFIRDLAQEVLQGVGRAREAISSNFDSAVAINEMPEAETAFDDVNEEPESTPEEIPEVIPAEETADQTPKSADEKDAEGASEKPAEETKESAAEESAGEAKQGAAEDMNAGTSEESSSEAAS